MIDEGETTKAAMPFGFKRFAEMFNSVPKKQYKFRLVTRIDADPEFWVRSCHIHTRFVNRKCYRNLITLSLITERGNADTIMLKTTMAAINQPHFANSAKTHFYQCHRDKQDEQALNDSDNSDSDDNYGGSDSEDQEPVRAPV
ncbi:hypothetical protein C0992_003907 [Termitomyces sp. T32_za158]|nr:hypothetical protein C0992_003907 [Termitomyces sp. T32_za158]